MKEILYNIGMKKSAGLFMFIFLLGSVAHASLADLNLTYASRYMFRGYDLNGNQPSLQPGATFYLGNSGFTFGLFGAYNLGDTTPRELTEVDYTLTYANAFNEAWNYSVYYSYYSFPPLQGPASRTHELFFSLTGNQLPLTPTLTASYDFELGNGSFFSLALKRSFETIIRLDTGLTIEYDNGQYGSPTGVSDCTVSCATSLPAGNFSIQPAAYYVFENKDLRGLDNIFWFSLGVSTSI